MGQGCEFSVLSRRLPGSTGSLRLVFSCSRCRRKWRERRVVLSMARGWGERHYGLRLIAIRVRSERNGVRLYRPGKWPVLRGTTWITGSSTAYLWATGFKPTVRSYDGWEVSVPLRLDVEHGEADYSSRARYSWAHETELQRLQTWGRAAWHGRVLRRCGRNSNCESHGESASTSVQALYLAQCRRVPPCGGSPM